MGSLGISLPLIGFQVSNLDDGTGEIAVLSRSGRAPDKGLRVESRGTLDEVAVLGWQSIGLHIREVNRRSLNERNA